MVTSSKSYENQALFHLIKECLNDSEYTAVTLESLHAAYHRALLKMPKKSDNGKPENDKPDNDKPENEKAENKKSKNDKPDNNKPKDKKPKDVKPEKDYTLEQDTARYAMMLFSIFFQNGHCNLVPQLYTEKGGIPDLILETFRRGAHRSYIKVYVEFKGVNGKNIFAAARQLAKAISSQHGKEFHDYGIFIPISGKEWLIMEYNAAKDGDKMDLEFYPLTARMPNSKGFSGKQSVYRDSFPPSSRRLGAACHGMRKDGTIEKATYKEQNGIFQTGGYTYKMKNYVMDFGKDFAYIACLMHWIWITRGNGVRRCLTERETTFASLSTMAMDPQPEEGEATMRSMTPIKDFQEYFLEQFSEKGGIRGSAGEETGGLQDLSYVTGLDYFIMEDSDYREDP